MPVKFAVVAPVANPTAAPDGSPRRSSSQEPATSSAAAVAGVTWRIAAFWSHALTNQSAAERGRVRAADDETVEPSGRHRHEPGLARGREQVDDVGRLRRIFRQLPPEGVGYRVRTGTSRHRPVVEAVQPGRRVVVRPIQGLLVLAHGSSVRPRGVRDHPPD